jgi:hypothetical protein
MKVQVIVNATGKRATLTTDHAASSYGQPILVLAHQAYGPGEIGCVRTAVLDTPTEKCALVLSWNRAVAQVEDSKLEEQRRNMRPGYTIDLQKL